MKKLSILASLLMASALAFSQTARSKVVVFKPEFPQNIIASPTEVSEFVTHWYKLDASFDELKVDTNDKKYFLMAKDSKQGRITVFRLRKVDGSYCISPIDRIGYCNGDQLDLSKFKIEKNKVVGCDEGLSTAGAY